MSKIDDSEQRKAGRERADRLQAKYSTNGGSFTEWFEQLYAGADGDPALIPWADLEPYPMLVSWLSNQSPPHPGTRAIDVGFGLGDNAAHLAEEGYQTVAIDLSPTAKSWAESRFANSKIDFRVADLFDLPDDLKGAFDLVHETYTLQSLPLEIRPKAFEAVASLVAPGGRLLVICRSREDELNAPPGPPWPLHLSELSSLERCGLRRISLERFEENKADGRTIPHFRLEYARPV